MKSKVIDKYLARYAEPEARVEWSPPGQWRHLVCIPASAEADSLADTLRSLAEANHAETALAVVVVNARESAPQNVHQSNAQTLDQLRELCGVERGGLSWGGLAGMGVLLVDRCGAGRWIPEGQGVGLARKIACDIALALITRGAVTGEWIRCTDADVEVPQDYFDRLAQSLPGVSATIDPFIHVPEGDELQRTAMKLYDEYLQSYVDGLRAAGSPYAFHTIGSLISVHAHSYAVVRGIPRREAGEDFYLLNKLAKVGRVHDLAGEPVRIRGRVSDRVPFGTGAALQEIQAALTEGRPTRHYDPQVFDGLAIWLAALDDFVADPDGEALQARVRRAPSRLSAPLWKTLSAMGAFAAAEQASEQVGGEQLRRRLMEWNDAFRTLKLIHGLRDGMSLVGE